jgi:hypothetical protein
MKSSGKMPVVSLDPVSSLLRAIQPAIATIGRSSVLDGVRPFCQSGCVLLKTPFSGTCACYVESQVTVGMVASNGADFARFRRPVPFEALDDVIMVSITSIG